MKKFNIPKFLIISTVILIAYTLLLVRLYHIESSDPDATITSLWDAFWWSTVTLTTVGYGDTFPVTDGGRAIGFVFLLLSISFYAIVIGQITSLMNTISENKKLGLYGTKAKGHSVIIGWSDFSRAVTDQLVAAKRKVAIVTRERDNLDLVREHYAASEVFVLFADYSNIDILTKVNIEESSIVFVNLDDDAEKLVFVLNLKKIYSDLKYIVSLDNADLKGTFLSAGVTYALSKNEIASKLLASYIFEPHVAQYNEEIISVAVNDTAYDMKEFRVNEKNPYKDNFYEKAFYDLKKECNAILVGVGKTVDGERVLHKNPETSLKIEKGDYLLVIVNGPAVKRIAKYFGISEGINE